MTPRIALNDDGKLFLRAADLDSLGEFMDAMFANKQAPSPAALADGSGDQTFFFGLQIDLIKVYKAVLKTGLNLVTHFYSDLVRNSEFDRARGILLEDVQSSDAATICQMSSSFTPDFPEVGTNAYQMMLDEVKGSLRFRMRLYGKFGYTAILAPFTEPLRAHIGSSLSQARINRI